MSAKGRSRDQVSDYRVAKLAEKPSTTESLQEKVAAAETQMQASLAEARASFKHGGTKGGEAERAFHGFLRRHLPPNLSVGEGEVIDQHGERSRQTDVVIADSDHPFTFAVDEPGLYVVEGVVGAGEVKSVLTADHLESAIVNSRQFKELKSEQVEGTTLSAVAEDQILFAQRPPYFLLAYESKLSLETVAERLNDYRHREGLEQGRIIDAAFLLGRGWAPNFGPGEGSMAILTGDEDARGFTPIPSDHVLFDFLMWFSMVMPRMVRTQPILRDYAALGLLRGEK
jgi:hypothetical protein